MVQDENTWSRAFLISQQTLAGCSLPAVLPFSQLLSSGSTAEQGRVWNVLLEASVMRVSHIFPI